MTVRAATTRDLPFLADVELRAAMRFVEVGMAAAARLPNVPLDLLARQQTAGLLWVAGDPPVGFAVAVEFPDSLHLHEIDVLPEEGGRGLGRALVGAVTAEAARRRLAEVTL